MEPATSISTSALPVINSNCVLRRNLSTQPYGRCSICRSRLRECHAWQSSALSFLLIVAVLSTMAVPAGWPVTVAAVTALGLIVVQGMNTHRRTDELIASQHRLQLQNAVIAGAKEHLERTVEARTRELRASNKDLARANLDAIESAKRRSAMVVDISHELRTPITSINGAAQNLLDGVSDPLSADQREYLEIIRDHAQRVSSVAEDIITAARGAQPTIELEPASIDVAQIAAAVVRGLKPMAEERKVALDVQEQSVRLEADEEKLRTAIENLVSNALKFTDAGGSVLVVVEATADGARVCVRDTGVGLDETERSMIFQRYYRASDRQPGTGVGLAIAKNLVLLHGGELTVSSTPGEGSEFVMTLPGKAA